MPCRIHTPDGPRQSGIPALAAVETLAQCFALAVTAARRGGGRWCPRPPHWPSHGTARGPLYSVTVICERSTVTVFAVAVSVWLWAFAVPRRCSYNVVRTIAATPAVQVAVRCYRGALGQSRGARSDAPRAVDALARVVPRHVLPRGSCCSFVCAREGGSQPQRSVVNTNAHVPR